MFLYVPVSALLFFLVSIVPDGETDRFAFDLDRASTKSFTVLVPTLRPQAFLVLHNNL